MIAASIAVIAPGVLLYLFISYCRSVMAASSRHALSNEVRDVTGIRSRASAQDFARVMQLLNLCPERPEDRTRLRAVGLYYSILGFVQGTLARMLPALRSWTEQERAGCSYFVAVALDRRIAFSREMLAQQSQL